MAKALNKDRMFLSRALIVLSFIIVVLTRQMTEDDSFFHELFDFTGYVLVVICGMGRLYTTAFLGGHKNKNLITSGPFSVVRNPLYVFSWLGFTGISLFSNHLWLIIIMPIGFWVIYHRLIKREETFLTNLFGGEYEAYCRNVPRFIPDFSKFQQPEEMTLAPKLLTNAFKDNIWWFMIPPIFELAELLLRIF
jgi:protein-S-isoprenylcysteine O-methyltransferase Ste14